MSTPTTNYQLDKPAVGGDADVWGGFLNVNLDDLDTFLGKPRWVKNAPVVAATTPINLALATFFEFTVSQATSIVFSNVPATLPDATVPVTRVLLKITNGAAFALTFPGSVVWPGGGGAPTFTASGVDLVGLVTYDAGTTWYVEILALKVIQSPGDMDVNGKLRSRFGNSVVINRVMHAPYTSSNRTINSGSEVSYSSFSLPANTLDRNGAGLRLQFGGLASTAGGTAVIKFGATVVGTISLAANDNFELVVTIIRRAASSQRFSFFGISGSVPFSGGGNAAEVETGAITIDFRGNSFGATSTLRTASIQTIDPETTQVA